jgi:oxygen-independent coproporphyrinogen-3 oxidase
MATADLALHFARSGGDPVCDAFTARRAVVPWRGKRPLPAEKIAGTWAGLLEDHRPAAPRLVYVHVPFCANHCLFCGFYRNAYTPHAGSTYADLVVAEIEREAAAPVIGRQPVAAVYLGGGTPSALSANELARILRTLKRCLPLAPDCEITVEGRIIHFDADKVDASLEAGANRFSIGVQSFDTAVRRRQGRRASKEDAIAFVEGLRDRGGGAVVIDLLYGLPGQSEAVWRDDLRIAAEIAPDGIDLYGLNLIPGTPLHTAVSAGKFPTSPALGELGHLYRIGAEYLGTRGWEQISNSHWRRTARERNIYNLRIKEGVDCLAYGSGAGGLMGRHSYALTSDLEIYAQGIRAGQKPIAGMRVADTFQPLRNLVTAGLETGRLDLGKVEGAAPVSGVRATLAPLLEQWQSAGLIRIAGDLVTLTLAGRFWYSNLVSAFDAVLCEDTSLAGGPPPSALSPPQRNKAKELS